MRRPVFVNRLLFGVLLVASAALTAEFTLPRAHAELSVSCFGCQTTDCPAGQYLEPTGVTNYVIRCQNHDIDPTMHCCSTFRRQYETDEGGLCYYYDCSEGTSNGQICNSKPPLD